MAYYLCPHCGEKSYIFGKEGAKETAKEMGLEFLGDVPLHVDIREKSDSGAPVTISDPKSPHAAPFFEIAKRVIEKMETKEDVQKPKIIIE